ncbi:metal transporter [Flavobacterium sp. NST-5]|uniref:Metal transporter n=1 Tax=Flavobacterium ichthyis TaxID=2698827 RepID=A0ABW9Z8Y4_9FLAO|nr:metal transporter [Flavobacterium ichthyis]NBL63807.1 metal transporter [Flavobacterium ichthyis]
MKKLLVALIVLMMGISTNAQEKKKKNAKHDIEVQGNCDMCKKRIEKAAYSVAGVKSAEWHQDDQTLHVLINEQKTSPYLVSKAVAQAGHDTKTVKATDENYEALHSCCAYERKSNAKQE